MDFKGNVRIIDIPLSLKGSFRVLKYQRSFQNPLIKTILILLRIKFEIGIQIYKPKTNIETKKMCQAETKSVIIMDFQKSMADTLT